MCLYSAIFQKSLPCGHSILRWRNLPVRRCGGAISTGKTPRHKEDVALVGAATSMNDHVIGAVGWAAVVGVPPKGLEYIADGLPTVDLKKAAASKKAVPTAPKASAAATSSSAEESDTPAPSAPAAPAPKASAAAAHPTPHLPNTKRIIFIANTQRGALRAADEGGGGAARRTGGGAAPRGARAPQNASVDVTVTPAAAISASKSAAAFSKETTGLVASLRSTRLDRGVPAGHAATMSRTL